jgi:hypothetical protein
MKLFSTKILIWPLNPRSIVASTGALVCSCSRRLFPLLTFPKPSRSHFAAHPVPLLRRLVVRLCGIATYGFLLAGVSCPGAGRRRDGAVRLQPEAALAAGGGGVLRRGVRAGPLQPHLRGPRVSPSPVTGFPSVPFLRVVTVRRVLIRCRI